MENKLIFLDIKNIHDILNINTFINFIYNNFNKKYDIKEITDILTSQYLAGYIIVNRNKIIGYIIGELHIMSNTKFTYFPEFLYVDTLHRKNGLGTLLFKKIINYCKENNIDNMMIDYETGNIIKSLLLKLKFEVKQFNNILGQPFHFVERLDWQSPSQPNFNSSHQTPIIYFLKIDSN